MADEEITTQETVTQEPPQVEAPVEAIPEVVVHTEVDEATNTPTTEENTTTEKTTSSTPEPDTTVDNSTDKKEIPKNEPVEIKVQEIKSNPVADTLQKPAPAPSDDPSPASIKKYLLGLLAKGRMSIQTRKNKNLEKLMQLFTTQARVTNNDVEKLLGVKDSTAGVYLNRLIKEGKIERHGTKKGTWYSIK